MTDERKWGERKEVSLNLRTHKRFPKMIVIYFSVFQRALLNYPFQNDLKIMPVMQTARPPYVLKSELEGVGSWNAHC